jgi:thioredoxin 1
MLLQEFDWEKDVLKSSKPVLVDFWVGWCQPCLMMNPTVEVLAKDFTVLKVNADRHSELAAQYGVTAFPTFMIFKDGQSIARHAGLTSEATLRRELTESCQTG